MPWRSTRYAGIEVKPLLRDPVQGLATVLMRMAPGAILPDHEHVLIEQTWVLEGHLVDRDGPDARMECKAGQFIWRPAGSRHSAWSPKGGTFLAMFQIPNKFYESDQRVTDISGQDWEELWGHCPGATRT
jgi:anti-sigma factor ChrR (cupin superfamily)